MKINIKKISISFIVFGFLFLGATYYFMQKSSHLVADSEQAALKLESVLTGKTKLPKKSIKPDNKNRYYYNDIELKQEEHIAINNCMQYYINEESFDNANKCEEVIVDLVIKNMGEAEFIKAIIGNMIHYKSDVSLKDDFPKTLFDTSITEAPLKSKLMLTFINRYRNPIKLQTEFDNYKDYFFGSISENLYRKLFKNRVNKFIESYDEINKQEDRESFFKEIYYKAETKNRHNEFWKFTFWKRRELEKNDKTIYSILKEIKIHYEK